MKDLFKKIILDFHKRGIPKLKNRLLKIPLNSNKIITLLGIRRCGKTYYMYQMINELLKKTKLKNIVYINFEDERMNLKKENLNEILEAYYELYPKSKQNLYVEEENKLYLFFDEIENIPGWDKFLRRVYDDYTKDIYITGSSTQLLQKDLPNSLRGRSLIYEMFPLSFKEFLDFRDMRDENYYMIHDRTAINFEFDTYLVNGGFPETFAYEKDLRLKTLQSYFDLVVYKDMIERYDIQNIQALLRFLKLSINNVSQQFSVTKFYNQMKTEGYKISKDQIFKFFSYVQDCYFLFPVNKYSQSFNAQMRNEKKIYCVDNGMAANLSFSVSSNKGYLLENFVYMELRRHFNEIFYLKNGFECDFLVKKRNEYIPIQVTHELHDKNYEREIKGLKKAMEMLGLKTGILLVKYLDPKYENSENNIEIKPVAQFLLEDNSLFNVN